jgi:anthranilate/para-aminobenzoate synthase component II
LFAQHLSIFHNAKNLFAGLPSPFKATRYHSLIIEKATCPKNLTITAETSDGIIMGIADEKLKIFGKFMEAGEPFCAHSGYGSHFR